jgi:alpha-N-arabinofuranosidase
VTVVRYPGGNFVSGYRWEDGIGPVDERPTRLEPAWHSIETNEFGLNEFMRWTRKAGIEPMLALNLGTRGIHEALELLEYANHATGTTLSDRRRQHGAPEPHGIRMWCLGNEMDGPWQLGHKTASEYGRLAAETARAMRQIDPDLELVACGSSSSKMPTFGAWEATVLEACHDLVDFISLHAYYEELDGDLASFLASGYDLDRVIENVAAIADAVGAGVRSNKRIQLSVDEWNVWYLRDLEARGTPKEWLRSPRISEEAYTVADAVVVGGLLISLLKHADRVTAACLAQLVNTIAPIKAEPAGPAWREASFYPFALTAASARGSVVRVKVDGPTTSTPSYGEVPAIDAVATFDPATREIAVFAVNRATDASIELAIDLSPVPAAAFRDAHVLTDRDVHARNTVELPSRVVPRAFAGADVRDGSLRLPLPAATWATARLTV